MVQSLIMMHVILEDTMMFTVSRSIIESTISENGEIVEMKDNKSEVYAAVLVEVICGMKYKRVIELISKDLSRQLILRLIQLLQLVLCAIMMEDAKNVTGNENTMQTLDIAEICSKFR